MQDTTGHQSQREYWDEANYHATAPLLGAKVIIHMGPLLDAKVIIHKNDFYSLNMMALRKAHFAKANRQHENTSSTAEGHGTRPRQI